MSHYPTASMILMMESVKIDISMEDLFFISLSCPHWMGIIVAGSHGWWMPLFFEDGLFNRFFHSEYSVFKDYQHQ